RFTISSFILIHLVVVSTFIFLNDTPLTHLYTLSLHDALPISVDEIKELRVSDVLDALNEQLAPLVFPAREDGSDPRSCPKCGNRSEEHTSELQSRENLVCRLLLEKKKTIIY